MKTTPKNIFARLVAALVFVLCLVQPAQAQWRDPAARGTAAITSGTIDNTVIGGTTPAAGTFTSLTASSLTSGRIPYATTGGLFADSAYLTWDNTNTLLSVGSGSTTNAGLTIGYRSSGFGGVWATKSGAPTTSNYVFLADGTDSYLNASSSVGLNIANSTVLSVLSSGAAVTGTLGVTGQASFAADIRIGTRSLISTTAPTISSGFGTTPSIAANNGTAAFTVNVGTGGSASSGVIGMPTATTGWNCHVDNRTGVAANRADQRTVQTATTTTTVTVQNQTVSTGTALAWTASDVLALICFAY